MPGKTYGFTRQADSSAYSPGSLCAGHVIDGIAKTGVLLLGNYRPTLSLARSLGRAGLHVVAGLGGGEGCTEYSRYAGESWEHPDPGENAEAFFSALSGYLQARPDIAIVYPVTEEFVLLFAEHGERLPQDRLLASPEPGLVKHCIDKERLLATALEAGLPVAPYAIARNRSDLASIAGELAAPLVVRTLTPGIRIDDEKALICTTPLELEKRLCRWQEEQTALLVQTRVTGHRHNLYFAAQNGRLICLAEARILRTDHPEGTGLAVEGETVTPRNDLTGYARRLLEALDYNGIGCIQFIVDDVSGAITLLEINPRITGSHAVAEAAGLELGRLAIVLAIRDTPEQQFYTGLAGLRYAWTYGDLRGLLNSWRHRRINSAAALRWFGGLARAALNANLHMTWSWRDPLPTLMLFARQLRVRAVPGLPGPGSGGVSLPAGGGGGAPVIRRAAAPVSGEVLLDSFSDQEWNVLVGKFEDASLEQAATRPVSFRRSETHSRIALRIDGVVLAAAHVRILQLPLLKRGLAYVKFGPLWRRRNREIDTDLLRSMLSVLVAEYVQRRQLTLTVLQRPSPACNELEGEILREFGFRIENASVDPNRYLVDLSLDEAAQRASLKPKWRYNLRKAQRAPLEICEVPAVEALPVFKRLHESMIQRKNIKEDIGILEGSLRTMPESMRVRYFIVSKDRQPVAAAVVGLYGDTAYYLYGASNNQALKLDAGYALHWHIVNTLRQYPVRWYDLGGDAIGTGLRQFKSGLVGRRGVTLKLEGEYNLHANKVSRCVAWSIFRLRQLRRNLRIFMAKGGSR
jgi:predicted ATP-grasp superfamily ATP-dependent carboligase